MKIPATILPTMIIGCTLSAFALIASTIVGSSLAQADELRYLTTCEIRDGRAYGSVVNRADSFDIDGYVLFYLYDQDGRLITTEDEYEYEYVSSRSTEEIEYTNAPDNATSCYFDPSPAIQGATPPDQGQYATSCEIRDGRGYGYVTNHGEAFEIDGTVWFYFFDRSGSLIGEEDESEYEYISSRSREEIEYSQAPSDAATCAFSIAGAIRR